MWLWLIILVAILFLLLVLLPYIIGSFQPEIVSTGASVELRVSAQVAWMALQRPKDVPITGHMNTGIGLVPSTSSSTTTTTTTSTTSQATWVEEIMGGERIFVKTRILDPKRRTMLREMKSDTYKNVTAHWTYMVEELDSGGANGKKQCCRVTVAGSSCIKDDATWKTPYFKFVVKMTGGLRKGMEDHLELLAANVNAESK